MSGKDDTTRAWNTMLLGNSVDSQIDALRQIAGEDQVTGLTVAVVSLAGSQDDEIRMWAAEALESSVQPQASEVPMLTKVLGSAVDGEICYWAATMLGRLGQEAEIAAEALESCLRESMYLPARERATWALSQIGPSAKVAVPALTEAAGTAPPRLKRMALEALEVITGRKADPSDDKKLAATPNAGEAA